MDLLVVYNCTYLYKNTAQIVAPMNTRTHAMTINTIAQSCTKTHSLNLKHNLVYELRNVFQFLDTILILKVMLFGFDEKLYNE